MKAFFNKYYIFLQTKAPCDNFFRTFAIQYRGMEQLAARWAHNPKVAGSSPAPATKEASASFFYIFASQYFCICLIPTKPVLSVS